MNRTLTLCLALGALLLAPQMSQAGGLSVAAEQEFNDFFFDRNVFEPGVEFVTGELEPRDIIVVEGIAAGGGGFGPHFEEGAYALYVKLGTTNPLDLVTQVGLDENNNPILEYNGQADFEVFDELGIGTSNFHSFFNQAVETPFVAVMDNMPPGTSGPVPDVTLGWLEAPFAYTQIDTDDDSSPLGDGLASALSGFVDGSGTIHLGVSGFADFDFDGFEDDGCDDEFCRGEFGDVDFLSFTGLTPGEFFFAQVNSQAGTDTLLGVFNDEGTPLAANDDFASDISPGQTSALGGLVPGNGTLNFAVSGSGDTGFFGQHSEQGNYTLQVQTAPVGLTDNLPMGDLVLLPDDENTEDGVFFFNDVEVTEDRPIFLDPEVAVGYEYTVSGGGIQFASVQLPQLLDDSEYTVTFDDGLGGEISVNLSAGVVYAFPAGGVSEFTVTGIDISEMLDPNDDTAFVTGVTFTGFTTLGSATVDITQQAITAPIPEPASVLLCGIGLVAAAACRRRS